MKKKRMAAMMLAGLMAAQGIWCGGCSAAAGTAGTVEEGGPTEGAAGAVKEDGPAEEAAGAVKEDGPTEEAAGAAEEGGTAAEAGKDAGAAGTELPPESASGGQEESAEDDSAPAYRDGANGFAFRFLREMLKETAEGENLVVSPYSVWLPLAALTNATDEAGREQLLCALGASGSDPESLGETVRTLNAALTQEENAAWAAENGVEYESPLKIANALFVDQDSKLNAAFAESFGENYEGKMFAVDFSDEAAAAEVNRWAAEKTDGKIEELVETFDPQTVAAIANAIYYSDSWQTEFSESDTKEDIFYGAKGEETVPFMNKKLTDVSYWEDEAMQAVCLGTESNGQMIILLPREDRSAEALLEGMDADRFAQITEAEWNTVQLSLPKFKLESGILSVKEAMERLGVPLSGGQTPLLTGLAEGEALILSEAVQKAVVEVDEKGMTAAAATLMGMMRTSMPAEREPVEMNCDRPFAFLVTADGGDQGQIVLFGGIVNQIGQ